jgi:hypothetical protein
LDKKVKKNVINENNEKDNLIILNQTRKKLEEIMKDKSNI